MTKAAVAAPEEPDQRPTWKWCRGQSAEERKGFFLFLLKRFHSKGFSPLFKEEKRACRSKNDWVSLLWWQEENLVLFPKGKTAFPRVSRSQRKERKINVRESFYEEENSCSHMWTKKRRFWSAFSSVQFSTLCQTSKLKLRLKITSRSSENRKKFGGDCKIFAR